MTKRITVKIPRLPVVVPTPEAAEPVFGPISWEFATQGDDADDPEAFDPPLELLHVRAFNFACATCPGAISWRLDPELSPPPDYALYQLINGAAMVQALTSSGTADLYAISATGAELGPIVIESVA